MGRVDSAAGEPGRRGLVWHCLHPVPHGTFPLGKHGGAWGQPSLQGEGSRRTRSSDPDPQRPVGEGSPSGARAILTGPVTGPATQSGPGHEAAGGPSRIPLPSGFARPLSLPASSRQLAKKLRWATRCRRPAGATYREQGSEEPWFRRPAFCGKPAADRGSGGARSPREHDRIRLQSSGPGFTFRACRNACPSGTRIPPLPAFVSLHRRRRVTRFPAGKIEPRVRGCRALRYLRPCSSMKPNYD